MRNQIFFRKEAIRLINVFGSAWKDKFDVISTPL